MDQKQLLKADIIKKALRDPDFRRKLIEDPCASIWTAFNVVVPESLEICIQEDSATKIHIALPVAPAELDERLLDAVAGGGMMCGQSNPPGSIGPMG